MKRSYLGHYLLLKKAFILYFTHYLPQTVICQSCAFKLTAVSSLQSHVFTTLLTLWVSVAIDNSVYCSCHLPAEIKKNTKETSWRKYLQLRGNKSFYQFNLTYFEFFFLLFIDDIPRLFFLNIFSTNIFWLFIFPWHFVELTYFDPWPFFQTYFFYLLFFNIFWPNTLLYFVNTRDSFFKTKKPDTIGNETRYIKKRILA